MRNWPVIFGLVIISLTLVVPSCYAVGPGVTVYAPSVSSLRVDRVPFTYNGSFVVQNNGHEENVYVCRASVDDPRAITWINTTPAGFVLSPGETKLVNFTINISGQKPAPGAYHFIFKPTRLPRNVEPYINKFARYISQADHYNLTIEVPGEGGSAESDDQMAEIPVVFDQPTYKVNLVQYAAPDENNTEMIEINRAIRINAPSSAYVGDQVPLSVSVFEGLNNRDIDLVVMSPDGTFYPVQGSNFTFTQEGRWGVLTMIGDQILLGKPLTISRNSGLQLVMPGMDAILLSVITLLLFASIVPIWLVIRGRRKQDNYKDIEFKAYIVRKYIDQFDAGQLKRAIALIEEEYNDLLDRNISGDRERARASIEELKTLSLLES